MSILFTEIMPFDEARTSATAKAIFERLDAPRKKTDIPIKPIIVEFFGTAKAGKDRQLVEVERWFRRQGFQFLIRQESAESEMTRGIPRVGAYDFEMTHFAYNFQNLIQANSDRRFHAVFLNRGLFDNLVHLGWQLRKGAVTKEQYEAYKTFALTGPWIKSLDAVVLLACSVEEALVREYGKDPNPKYGSRMNPKSLDEMLACVVETSELIERELPGIPIFKIDTTGRSIDEVKGVIIASLVETVRKNLGVSEDEVFIEEPGLMKQKAVVQPQEIKIRGHVRDDKLREMGWFLDSATTETDIYLTKNGLAPLTNDECFHLRKTSGGTFFVFKWGPNGLNSRTKLVIPLSSESETERALRNFTEIVTFVKKRTIYRKNGFVLSLDSVDKLGDFTEIRGHDINADLEGEVKGLGLVPEDVVPETYLRLYLKTIQ
ncbi:MAG: CYTH domain-containing protein [Patescibacteria group bacterium]